MSVKTWLLSLAVVLLFTAHYSWSWLATNDPLTFEKITLRTEASLNPKCLIKASVLEQDPDDLVLMCAAFGTLPYLHAKEYPEQAVKLYTLLGKMSEWHQIIETYGAKVIPVVWSYYRDGSRIFIMQERLRTGIRELLDGKTPTFQARELTPLEFAVGAVAAIHKHGHRFLDPFEVRADGTVKVKPIAKTMSMFVTGFTSGINKLEQKYAQGKKITAFDVGWAAFDTAVIAAVGVSAVIALKKATLATTAKTATAKGVKVSATKTFGVAGKTLLAVGKAVVPKAAALGLGYLAITHPWSTAVLTAGALRWSLEQLGMSTTTSFVLAWVAVSFVIWVLFWPVTWLLRLFFRFGVKPTAQVIVRRT